MDMITFHHVKQGSLLHLGLLNPSPHWEMEDGQIQSPSSLRRKRTTDGRRQTVQIGHHSIGGDNIGLIGTPLI